ncbi:MAG TPA: hypothetical protein VE932_04930 [Patescibacteria group bacterium]|nr:hypothetical protein [Patescibacteria group bacterium]
MDETELNRRVDVLREALRRVLATNKPALSPAVTSLLDHATMMATTLAEQAAAPPDLAGAMRGLIAALRGVARSGQTCAVSIAGSINLVEADTPLGVAFVRYRAAGLAFVRATEDACAELEEAVPTMSPEWLRRFLDSFGHGGAQ